MRFAELARTSAAVAETSARSAKIARLADCLRRLSPDEIPLAVMVLTGQPPPARGGLGLPP